MSDKQKEEESIDINSTTQSSAPPSNVQSNASAAYPPPPTQIPESIMCLYNNIKKNLSILINYILSIRELSASTLF